MRIANDECTQRGLLRFVCPLLAVCLVAALLCALAGCKESDSIVERVYDQTSPNVDVDNPDKVYIPDEKSKIDIRDLHLDVDKLFEEDRIKRDLPDEKGDEDDDDKEAPKTERRRDASSTRTSARVTGGGTEVRAEVAGGDGGGSAEKSKAGSGGAKGTDGTGQSDEKGTGPGKYTADMNDDDYQDRTYDSTYGKTSNLPDDVKTIVAAGELATVALVLGDEETLVGSAKDYLGSTAVKKVFSKKGVSKAKAVWSGGGSKTKAAEVDAIVDLKPDAVVVFPGQISAKQERIIAQNAPGTAVVTLPRPTSEDNIKTEVKGIAKLISKATGGASSAKADEYLDFVKDVKKEAEDAHGGGLVTYDSVDYGNTDGTKTVRLDSPSGKQLWTLYISGWDADASVTATYEKTTLFKDTGAAYTNIGWAWSPLSYYMSVGGVINNAAAYGPLSTKTVQPVLTLNENQVSYKWKKFCVDVDESKGGGSFTNYRAFYVLTNAREGVEKSGTNPAFVHMLGNEDFSSVIVASPKIAKALKAARKESNGLYTMYGLAQTASETAYGRKFEGSKGQSIVYSTVKGDAGYDIYVNPCGYVGSWADGSIESPLEALWIASKYWGYSESDLKACVKRFYDDFYDGYSPDVDKILSGAYAD